MEGTNMPTGFNFFSWIREGVKQSVLLGVSDAVEHMGTPHEGDEVTQKLTAFLQDDHTTQPRLTTTATSGRKKLGRTLEEIQATAAKNAS
jgi:hypothetical protein